MSSLLSLALLAAAASPAAAFWRLPCKGPIVVERTDPIVNPGAIAGHVHTIMGGNGFSATMDYNSTQASTCASCTVIGDNSNYWVPSLYFRHQDGTFESVKQLGGGLIYYLQRAPKGVEMKAFPEGLQMLAGDPNKRSGGDDFASQAISYACLDYNGPAKKETGGFPNYNCPNGLRAQVFFPACWDGKNLDSADHKSHVAYPVDAYNSGKCPSSHPVPFVSIFYEVIWDTGKFADKWYGGEQPFVWSNGDPTGFGYHGDFVNGWEIPLLQNAINTCTAQSGNVEDCKAFTLRPDKQAEGCTIPGQVDEEVFGTLDKLPGCNAVVGGPGPAPKPSGTCASNPSLGNGSKPTGPSVDGWTYVGCGTDDYYNRALTKARTASDDMTNAKCAAFCKDYKFFGTEYAKECYCDNVVPDAAAPIPGVNGLCKMPCAGGDGKEMCGGGGALTLFQKGGSGNAPVGGGSSSGGNSGSGSGSGSSSAAGSKPTGGASTGGSSGSGSNNGGSSSGGSGSVPSGNTPIDTSTGNGGSEGVKNNVGSGSGSGSGSDSGSGSGPGSNNSGSGSKPTTMTPISARPSYTTTTTSSTTSSSTSTTTSSTTTTTTATTKPTNAAWQNWQNAYWGDNNNIRGNNARAHKRDQHAAKHAHGHARRRIAE